MKRLLVRERQMRRATLLTTIAENEEYLNLVKEEAAETRRSDLLVDQEARGQPVIDAARRALESSLAANPNVELLLNAENREAAWEALDIVEQRRTIRRIATPVVYRIAQSRADLEVATSTILGAWWRSSLAPSPAPRPLGALRFEAAGGRRVA